MSEQDKFTYDGYAIFEAMGHIKRVGKVRTSELGGNAVFIVETSDPEGQAITEIFAASALFRLTPITEVVSGQMARSVNPSPIAPYDLPNRVQRALRVLAEEDRQQAAAIDAGEERPRSRFDRDEDDYEDVEF
jgi:hypothetical protein